MTDHPSTFNARDTHQDGIQWQDRAELHRVDDGDGLLDGAKGLSSGTFAEMIRHMMLLPKAERSQYSIQKAGDREYHAGEVAALSEREDFPQE